MSRRGAGSSSANIRTRKSSRKARSSTTRGRTKSWRTTKQDERSESTDGKTDCLRRRLTAGDSSRRQQPGQRGQGYARTARAERHPRAEVRVAHHHQGWRDGGEGNRAEGCAREHGRADGEGGREQNV